ncbi:alpha/beta hydrolase [Actinokineospora auranticolor]|uniref:Acetyl esterase n=1 Tax=Actinokineospora auranticolor TaxID=155976 RepID=A0A2S6GFP7_9PSEU|nr:alpha/beta hydrolase [Actinokineospora auranticolor]PPK64053.1 acetyl esterase [Actinokineospora auranticolor]
MPLHPQVRTLVEAGGFGSPMTQDTLAQARVDMTTGAITDAGPGTQVADVVDVDADGVPVRFYRPDGEPTPPVVLYLHSGGWTTGGIQTHDAVCRFIAALSGAAVALVDYRLAPEHPFPAALDDADRALNWLRATADKLVVDVNRIGVVGDSAGGHLAAVLARRQRDLGTPLRCQVLVYPVLDAADELTDVDSPALAPDEMAFCWNAYAPVGIDRSQPDLAPGSGDLSGLPPTLVITAEYDVLRGSGEAYADRLADAGVPVVCVRYLGQVHSFFRKPARFDAARQAIAQVAATLRAELA